jgi:hypothetical protein
VRTWLVDYDQDWTERAQAESAGLEGWLGRWLGREE